MPWCPKCKTEYREGFKVCADCGSELAEEEQEDPFGEEFPDREFVIRETDNAGELAVPEGEGTAEAGEFMVPGEGEAAGAGALAVLEGRRAVRPGRGGNGPYQDSSERASDNRSSAWVLLCLGTCGLLAVVLGAVGVLPFNPGDPYLFYGVMGAVFILFVVAGVVSLKNAKIFEKKAESENFLRQTLLDWCRENLNASDIDAQVCAAGASEEIAYFRRSSYIKERLNRQFVNLNQDFLERLIDDHIYDGVFGEKCEK